MKSILFLVTQLLGCVCVWDGVFRKAFRRVSCVHGEVESLCGRTSLQERQYIVNSENSRLLTLFKSGRMNKVYKYTTLCPQQYFRGKRLNKINVNIAGKLKVLSEIIF